MNENTGEKRDIEREREREKTTETYASIPGVVTSIFNGTSKSLRNQASRKQTIIIRRSLKMAYQDFTPLSLQSCMFHLTLFEIDVA